MFPKLGLLFLWSTSENRQRLWSASKCADAAPMDAKAEPLDAALGLWRPWTQPSSPWTQPWRSWTPRLRPWVQLRSSSCHLVLPAEPPRVIHTQRASFRLRSSRRIHETLRNPTKPSGPDKFFKVIKNHTAKFRISPKEDIAGRGTPKQKT